MTLFATFPIINSLSSAEAATSVASTTTLNMTLGYTSANLDLVVRDSSGTFASSTDDQLAKFGITTTNHAGYTLTIEGSDNNGQLSNGAAGTNLASISDTTDFYTFSTTSTFNGKWGYKPSKFNSSTNASYRPAPTTVASTLDKTTSSNNEAVNYSIGLGARVDYGTPTGTYTNTYILAAVANGTPYTVSFLDNTSDPTVTGLPQYITGEANTTSVTLPSATPIRTGYTFSGWCESAPTINADGSTTCSTATIAAGADYDFINQTTNTNNVNLYTTWTINTYDLSVQFSGGGVSSVKVCTVSGDCSGANLKGTITTSGGSVSNLPYNTTYYLYPTFVATYALSNWVNINSAGILSCVTTDTCSTDTNPTFTIKDGNGAVRITSESSGVTLQTMPDSVCTTTPQDFVDARDGQSYTVQRLADGNCWMMQNLNLGDTVNYPLLAALTEDNTNISAQVANTSDVAKNFANYKVASGTHTYASAEYIYVNGVDSISNEPYGTLYNGCAATAGTICTNSSSDNASYDICPKGWRLPTGNTSGEFANLYAQSAYNSYEKMRGNIANGGAAFTLAGYFSDSTPVAVGFRGLWWASTNLNTSTFYSLKIGTSPDTVTTTIENGPLNKSDAGAIRCIKKTYMQDVTGSTVSNMNEGDTINVTDKRDEQQYTATRINGDLWMTRNLAIGCAGSGTNYSATISSKSLTPFDSNVPSSSFSTPTASLDKSDNTTGCTSSSTSDCASYDTSRMKCSSSYGAWYNYAAASAGTITGSSNSSNATYDICPKGWRLFTSVEGNGIISYKTQFRPITGGSYGAGTGSLADASNGYFWSSTVQTESRRYSPGYNGSTLSINDSSRTSGLYVRCIFNDRRTVNDITYLQEMTGAIARNTTTGTTATLKDNRDNQTYTVKKLDDGNIWMIDNLNLGATTLSTDLTSANTNLSTTVTASTFNGWKKTSGSETYTAGEFIPVSGTDSTSGTAYGTLYNYCATSAGTICTSSNSNNATYDICPKGWRLPTGGSSGEFQTLYNNSSYNTNAKMRASIANGGAAFALPGYFSSGTPMVQGSIGRYWSSTRYNSTYIYYLNLDTSNVDPASSSGRIYGGSIRCIAK